MSTESPIAQTFSEQRALREWAQRGLLDVAGMRQAQALLGPRPTPEAWHAFAERLCLYLGALLLGAGVVCFVAYNWDDLSKFGKLFGTQALLVIGVGLALRLGVRTTAGRAALLFASIALGALFALIGQTYQTGADTWELFALWAALMLPWAIAARWAPLWLLWIGVVNVALYFRFDLGGRWWWWRSSWDIGTVWTVIGLCNLALLALWETGGERWQKLDGRYGPRLVLLAAMVPMTLAAGLFIVDSQHRDFNAAHLLAWAAATIALLWIYRDWRRDLAAMALLCLGAICIVTTALVRWLIDSHLEAAGWLVVALALVGMSVAVSMWLLRLRREVPDGAV